MKLGIIRVQIVAICLAQLLSILIQSKLGRVKSLTTVVKRSFRVNVVFDGPFISTRVQKSEKVR
jgi:hypothetical protein